MARWLAGVVARIRELAAERRVLFTLKARRELATLELALDEEDACSVLADLEAEDFSERLESDATREWMYVFKPLLTGALLYVKIILRNDCIVVSFHEDDGESHEEEDDA
jgi:hypothetical protein